MAGDAELSLIPGMNQTARTYDVSVVPPPGSPYAATCVQQAGARGDRREHDRVVRAGRAWRAT